jgi:hypothetical protein
VGEKREEREEESEGWEEANLFFLLLYRYSAEEH